MNYLLIGGAAIVGLLVLFQLFRKADMRKVASWMRWIVGGAAALITGFLLLRGQAGIAAFTGYAAYSVLRTGRLGPLVFEGRTLHEDNESAVRSRYISMSLDHESGVVSGRVVSGAFRGRDLIGLGENETRELLAEVSADTDSLALLETWLDKNRAGWREYFEQQSWAGATTAPDAVDEDALAYEILGLKPGATEEDIRAAHRNLMKGVHPDQGGSTFLAAKINGAKDRLLKKVKG